MVKTKRMGGKREGAGAKPYATQLLARELVELGGDICKKVLKREGEFKDIDVYVLIELASKFAVKAIPQQFEGEIREIKYQEIVHVIEGLDTRALRDFSESCRMRTLPQRAA